MRFLRNSGWAVRYHTPLMRKLIDLLLGRRGEPRVLVLVATSRGPRAVPVPISRLK